MTSLLGPARVKIRRPLPVPPRPRLTIVPKLAARAPRIPFVVLVVLLLAAGLIGLLLLNTALQRGTYRVSALQTRADGLALQQQQLEREISDLSQPGRVAREAARMGMVQNVSPAFLDLQTGRIRGDVHVASPADAFPLPPLTGDAAQRARTTSAAQQSESERDRMLASDHRTVEQIAAQKAARQRAAEQKAARQKAAQNKAARQKAAKLKRERLRKQRQHATGRPAATTKSSAPSGTGSP